MLLPCRIMPFSRWAVSHTIGLIWFANSSYWARISSKLMRSGILKASAISALSSASELKSCANSTINQVGDTNAPAGDFVFVTRPDAAGSGSDGNAILSSFGDLLDDPMEREDYVGAVADAKLCPDVNANRLERGDLFEKGGGVNHDAVSDDCQNTGPQNAAGNQLEYELLFAYVDGVAGVVSALVTGDRLKLFGEEVDDFTFTFVAPLGPENNEIGHETERRVEPKLAIVPYARETVVNTRLWRVPKAAHYANLGTMQMCEVFVKLGPEVFRELLRHVSMGKLKTYQIYDRFKVRARLSKLNSETLRKAEPKLWARIEAGEEDFATDLSQVFLLSHLDMIVDVLNLLNIPHQDGFFDKDLNAGRVSDRRMAGPGFQRVFGEVSPRGSFVLHQSPPLGTHETGEHLPPRGIKEVR